MSEQPHTLKFYRRKLPHWIVADHSYFVTIRVKGSIPALAVRTMQQERAQLKASSDDDEKLSVLKRQQFNKLEQILDNCQQGAGMFDSPEVAEVLISSLDWLRGRGWTIYAFVVMSTHVHFLMRNKEQSAELLHDIGQYKRHTARVINKTLAGNGSLWAREDFDHWIRSHNKFVGVVRYIANNPVKAGLVSNWSKWPWTVIDESVADFLD